MSDSKVIDALDHLLPLENRGAELAIAQSDLCPALVIRSRSRQLRLFADLEAWGLEGPARAAIPTAQGIQLLSRPPGTTQIDGRQQAQPWLLCWFAGGRGWDRLHYGQPCHWRGCHPERPFPRVDIPWLLVLQHRAESIRLDAGGLDLVFPDDAGTVVAMPLFGLDLPSIEKTRSWDTGLPDDVQERCRRWATYLRRVPLGCRETFHIDEERDRVRIHQTFDYLSIDDDWNTPAETVAPYPPFALLAARYGFPVEFEEKPSEDEMATLFGPYGFRLGANSAAYELHGLLRYIRDDEIRSRAPQSAAGERAVERLRSALAGDPRLPTKTSGGFTRGLALALTSYYHALPYLTEDQRRSVAPIMDELVERILDPANYLPLIRYPTATGDDPVGEAVCQRTRDAYKVVQANFYGLWATATHAQDWKRVEEAWPLVRRWFHLPFQTQWLSPLPVRWEGLDIARALFDGTIGFARLAARLGAIDEYRRACYLFAKVCAGWFAMEHMSHYHRHHAPWLVNAEADYLVWHPCRLNGYVAIANDHLLPNESALVDGRGWASSYGRMTPTSARFWRDYLRDRADEVLNEILPRCRPDWAAAGVPAVMRAYVLGESAERLEERRAADEAAEQQAGQDPLRRRTYRLFQTTPVLKEIAAAEAGAEASTIAAVPAVAPMTAPEEGASATAGRFEAATMPVQAATADETGSFPLLYWPGVRTPTKPYTVYHERLDVLPFGTIRTESTDPAAPKSRSEVLHPNWCLTVLAQRGAAIESVDVNRQSDGSFVVSWTTPSPANSIVQFWRHDPGERRPDLETIEDPRPVSEHRLVIPPHSPDDLVWYRVLSFESAGRLYRSQAAMLPTPRTNWALDCTVYVAKRFPFKEFKYTPDRERWLERWRQRPAQWQVLKPPNELTDGRGLRCGVEPWIRRAEPDPAYCHWIAVDLGAVRPVDEVVLAHDPAWASAAYRIEAGPGDVAWSEALASPLSGLWNDLLVETTDNTEAIARHRFPCRRTRWIRILYAQAAPVGLSANRVVLWEIEVRGPRESPPGC